MRAMLSRSATPCCMRPHRCSCTRLARLPATAAYALQQQRQVRITAAQPLAPHSTEEAASKSIDEEIVAAAIAAEEQLQQQLRSLTLSVDATFKPLAAASAADVPPAPQQPQHHQQLQPQQQRSQQQRLSWLQQLTAKLPKFDGRFRGLVLLNVMTIIMASNWSVVKSSADAATMTDATTFMSMRFLLASALFLPFFKPKRKIVKAGLEIGFWYAAGYVTQALALSTTAASRASLLSTFTVLAVPMIAGLSGAHIRPIVWGCAAAALAGTAMLEEGSTLAPNIGDAWAVLSAVLFAAQIVTAEKCMRTLPPRSELPLMAVSMTTVGVLTTAAAAAMHAHDFGAMADGLRELFADWQAVLPAALGGGGAVDAGEAAEAARTFQQLFYTAVISTDLVLFVELVALQDVTSTDAAMIYSMEPVIGALLAYALLGERWGPWGWVGGAVIMAASLFTQFAGATDDNDASMIANIVVSADSTLEEDSAGIEVRTDGIKVPVRK